MTFSRHLREFLNSEKDFSVVYSTLNNLKLVSEKTARLVVLDSSFNPPHYGHYSLAKEALFYDYEDGVRNSTYSIDLKDSKDLRVGSTLSKGNLSQPKSLNNTLCSLLLLLSVKNADKIHPAPALFEHRLAMMQLMAQKWYADTNVDVSIGITRHAKFVDKLVSIIKELELPVKLTFAVGYDTLVRILDEKYYVPDKLLDSLREFMASSDIFCLTRTDADKSDLEQIKFVKDVGNGHFAHIPLSWAKSIHMVNVPESAVCTISSSQLRRNYAENESVGSSLVDKSINNYILENKLYD